MSISIEADESLTKNKEVPNAHSIEERKWRQDSRRSYQRDPDLGEL